MAKSMSLNPGADATLVQAATNAAMANVPQDLSKQFESLAQSYDDSMQAVAEAAEKVAGKLVPLAANMVKKAIKRKGQRDQYGGNMILRPVEMEREAKEGDKDVKSREDFDNDQASTGTYEDYLKNLPKVKYQGEEEISVHDMLTNIRNEQISLKGKNDPDSKKRRIELKAEKQSVYSELDALDAAETANTELLASGNFDEAATGQKATTMAAAIQAYNSPSGKIIEEGPYKGYHVTLGQNANKEFTFILRNEAGDVITHEDENGKLATGGDTPYSINSNQVGSLLVSKYDESKYAEMNKNIFDPLTDTHIPIGKINIKNKVAAYCNTETDLLGLMEKPLGVEQFSFKQLLNQQSTDSAEIFASLGQVKLEELGVKDSDGDGKIGDEGDFLGENGLKNYQIVKNKILDKTHKKYNFKDTQNAFLAHAQKAGENMYNFVPKYKPSTNNNNNNDSTRPFQGGLSAEALGYAGKGWQSEAALTKRRNAVESKSTVHGLAGDYLWNGNVYKLGDKSYTPYKVKENEGLLVPGVDKDPTEYDRQRKSQFEKHSAADLTSMATFEGADDKQIVSIFNNKYKDSKFKIDHEYSDFEEAIYITHSGGNEQKILLSATTAQDIADYMNEYDPKYKKGQVIEMGKGKNKKYGKFVSIEEGFIEVDKAGNPI